MMNQERFESLRKLAPFEAVQAWVEGRFGIGDEPALLEAIRRDQRVALSDDEIIDLMCDAVEEGLDARQCWDRLVRAA